MAEVLRIQGLTKRFGQVVASENLDLTLNAGEIHALIGPNGAGKSTVIKQICGELHPDAGEIRFCGEEVIHRSTAERARLGMARSFQVSNVALDFTVAQNIVLALVGAERQVFRFLRPAMGNTAMQADAAALTERVGLSTRMTALAQELSHGERRRLEIAMALALKPKAFLLDEPMAGMGTEGAAELTGLLEELKHDAPILLVEHDMDAVFRLADRITVLSYGRALATGTVNEVRADPAVREVYLGDDP